MSRINSPRNSKSSGTMPPSLDGKSKFCCSPDSGTGGDDASSLSGNLQLVAYSWGTWHAAEGNLDCCTM